MCTKYPYVAMISDFAKITIIKVRFYLLILKFVKNQHGSQIMCDKTGK